MAEEARPDPNGDVLAFPETVCHRTLTSELAYCPQASHRGRTLYFCTEACLEAFRRDPDRFLAAHSRRRMK